MCMSLNMTPSTSYGLTAEQSSKGKRIRGRGSSAARPDQTSLPGLEPADLVLIVIRVLKA